MGWPITMYFQKLIDTDVDTDSAVDADTDKSPGGQIRTSYKC